MPLFHRRDLVVRQLLELYRRPNRYRPVKQLGEGGLATVSSCFDTYLGRVVALKELKEQNLGNAFMVKSFVNEARMVGYLDHPGVVSVFDTFVLDQGRICYTMTLVEGKALSELLDTDNLFRKGPRMPIVKAVEIFTKIAETMAYVHDRGVLHLDLKPDNIMVGKYGEVKVMDWGNALLFDPRPYEEYLRKVAGDHAPQSLEPEMRRNVVFGTPLYMSPEQTCTPRDQLTVSSDIFSAGVVLYEMLTGSRAFQAETSEAAMEKVRSHDPSAVDALNRDAPRRLAQICEKMIAKRIDERYASFHEILDELAEFSESGQAFATRSYEPGQAIFAEGDRGEYAFTVQSGKVEIFRGEGTNRTVLAVLGPGEVVGELAVFTDHARTASATAIEPTVIRVMGAADVRAELEKLRPWVGAMVKNLSERFIGLSDKLVAIEQRTQRPSTTPGATPGEG